VLHLQLQKSAGVYQVRPGALNDAGAWTDSGWYYIQNKWSAVELDYQGSAYDGAVSLYIDGALKQSLIDIDNDTRTVDAASLGAMGVDAGASGSLYFDDFDSRRFSYIGTLLDPGVEEPGPGTPVKAGWRATTAMTTRTRTPACCFRVYTIVDWGENGNPGYLKCIGATYGKLQLQRSKHLARSICGSAHNFLTIPRSLLKSRHPTEFGLTAPGVFEFFLIRVYLGHQRITLPL
jgi:hypothetical protein